MSLRRTIRNAIKSGSTMYARVEGVNLGLATVRLGGTGRRMTNLSVLGGEVQAGDEVIVDWSAGTNPIVRPLFLEDPEPVLSPGVGTPDILVEENDIGACEGNILWNFPYPMGEFPYGYSYDVAANTPKILCGGEHFGHYFDYDEGGAGDYWSVIYDSSNCIIPDHVVKNGIVYPNLPLFRIPGYITIPVSGKYLIGFNFNEYFEWNWTNYSYGYDWWDNPNWSEESAYYRIRVMLNDTTPLGVGTGTYGWGYHGATDCQILIIEYLEAGDKLSFEIYFNSSICQGFMMGAWFAWEPECNTRWIQYLPGT